MCMVPLSLGLIAYAQESCQEDHYCLLTAACKQRRLRQPTAVSHAEWLDPGSDVLGEPDFNRNDDCII